MRPTTKRKVHDVMGRKLGSDVVADEFTSGVVVCERTRWLTVEDCAALFSRCSHPQKRSFLSSQIGLVHVSEALEPSWQESRSQQSRAIPDGTDASH